MHVIPAVNAANESEAEEQLRKISGFAEWVHVDVVDGKFAPNVTWGNPEGVSNLKSQISNLKNVNIEVHLMVKNPEEVVPRWGRVADRVIVHVEAMKDRRAILRTAKEHRLEAMLAIQPGTANAKLEPHLTHFNFFQVLAVLPGKAGQKFDPRAVDRIKFLRSHAPGAIIEVDGGINPATATICRDAGAHIFVAASYILGSENPEEAYRTLHDVVTR